MSEYGRAWTLVPGQRALRRLEPGERFGRLVVKSANDTHTRYVVRCDCGCRLVLRPEALIGRARNCKTSCGCDRGAAKRAREWRDSHGAG